MEQSLPQKANLRCVYAMYFMNEKAVAQLDNAKGFEVGVGPSIVMVDEGIYAFVFSQKGLMAALGLQGNKISQNPA